jgi:membrane associated rhomboid family serine protease
VAAAITQVFFNLDSRVPMVGASGAIAGVMGAYLVKFPHSRIVTLFFFIFIAFIDVPAWAMLIYWFAIQFFSGVGSIGTSAVSQGGTAFFAHIGGFLTGIVLINIMGTRERYSRRRDLYW